MQTCSTLLNMLVWRPLSSFSRIFRSHRPRNLLKLTPLSDTALRITKAYFCSSISAKINVNGVDLHYEQHGSSQEQVVLCLPGALGSTQSDFGPQLTGLSDEFTVVAFDPRGYGKSIPPARDFPSDFFVRDAWDASELMQKLGFKKYSLLGWSDGGITSLILAGSNPRAISKMVIWGSNAFVTNEDMELFEKLRDTDTWHPKMKAPLEALYGHDGLKSMWGGWIDAFDRFCKQKDGNICREYLPKIKCPTLIIHGQKDPLVPDFHPEYIHKNIAGSTLHLMPEGRHNLHLRYFDKFNSMVRKFLKEKAKK